MDNEVLRKTYRSINACYCPFEKSILTNNCACSRARRFCLAEREGVSCSSEAAQGLCVELLEVLRRKARFALKATGSEEALPHSKAMRIQVGGLRGLAAVVAPEAPVPEQIDDVYDIVAAAQARFGSFDDLPFQSIIQQIAAYRGRRRLRGQG